MTIFLKSSVALDGIKTPHYRFIFLNFGITLIYELEAIGQVEACFDGLRLTEIGSEVIDENGRVIGVALPSN